MPSYERLVRASSETSELDENTWWARYVSSLKESSLTETALDVLSEDSRYIVEAGIFGDGIPDLESWPQSRHRSGLVMGAVQSGKTASMLGVAAQSLDAGVEIVVVLAGTRLALWNQTFNRLVHQLNPSSGAILLPSVAHMLQRDGLSLRPDDLYQVQGARVRRALRDRTPIVIVAMKHGQHLRAVAKILHDRIFPEIDSIGRSVHLLVLDDEADDGSILDAEVETDLDPTTDAFKQIPRLITDLWSRRVEAPTTAKQCLFATYVGYTATPQANFLQADLNPLAPRNFVAALRTPWDVGLEQPRSPTFREPLGLRYFYTGGDIFYKPTQGPGALTVSQPNGSPSISEEEVAAQFWIADALRSYLVAGAIRLWRSKGPANLASIRSRRFASEEEARQECPKPHTMLFHASASVDDHFQAAAAILEWSSGLTAQQARTAIDQGQRELDVAHLKKDLQNNEAKWMRWLEDFAQSANALSKRFSENVGQQVASQEDWPELRDLLEHQVFPNVEIAIVNSDPHSDDRPEFDVTFDGDAWIAPKNLYTVFVSGNVMARGLTLEGLTTSLFLRTSTDAIADTQMQMQRWFGYRGSYLDLCRVFIPEEQLSLFIQYNEGDAGLRAQIIDAMNLEHNSAPSPTVIEGLLYRSTGKIANVSKVPLSPGATPFIRLVNPGFQVDPNFELLSEIFTEPSTDLTVNGTLRGRILNRPVPLHVAAAFLDRLTYESYSPDLEASTSLRWAEVEAMLGLVRSGDSDLVPLFRPPVSSHSSAMNPVPPTQCPYNIAAYLRLWAAALERRARGIFPTDAGDTPWASLDLELRRSLAPDFWIGIRYGSGNAVEWPGSEPKPLFQVRPMIRGIKDGLVATTWGSRNPGSKADSYRGDQFFDYHHHGAELLPEPLMEGPQWRPLGSPGQILFHVIQDESRPHPVVAVGIAMPLGGPDHFAAVTRPERSGEGR